MSPRKTLHARRRTGKQEGSKSANRVADPWKLSRSGQLQVLQLAPFAELPWLVHGFSTIAGGVSDLDDHRVLNLGYTQWDKQENVVENRRRVQAAVSAADFALVPLKQIHSDVIHVFPTSPQKPCQGDALITNEPALLLAVQTADCVPILLVDPKTCAVAAVHAGWRGTLARIAQKTVGRMQLEFGTQPSDVLAAIGPSIGSCCYEVGAELVTKFTSQFADAESYFDEPRSGDEPNPLQWLNMKPPGHQPPPQNVHLDLRAANRSQLLAAGLHARNIFVNDLCTGCNPSLFFSYRKQGELSGRLMSVIGIREKDRD